MRAPYKEPKGVTAFLLSHFYASIIAMLALLTAASAAFGYLLHLYFSAPHA